MSIYRFIVEVVHFAVQIYIGSDLDRDVYMVGRFVKVRNELFFFRGRRIARGRFPQYVIEQRLDIAIVFEISFWKRTKTYYGRHKTIGLNANIVPVCSWITNRVKSLPHRKIGKWLQARGCASRVNFFVLRTSNGSRINVLEKPTLGVVVE